MQSHLLIRTSFNLLMHAVQFCNYSFRTNLQEKCLIATKKESKTCHVTSSEPEADDFQNILSCPRTLGNSLNVCEWHEARLIDIDWRRALQIDLLTYLLRIHLW